MGRPPSNGAPAFRFNPTEVAEMETILQEHKHQVPTREVLTALAEKFSNSPERAGKFTVQMKQVWNWFQNRRYALRSKLIKPTTKLNVSPVPHEDVPLVRNVLQAPQPVTLPPAHNTVRNNSENPMEFEAKSARDGAWYDVQAFISHRYLETGDPEVLVRFSGFGPEEDEWINVRRHVRQRSLPCESSECVAVLPGDLILCFQEGKEQALYFDAHVLDAQRRRHDVRGCRCRFLVRYDHDQSEEIVPLRKICRRPETDYRLQQLHAAANDFTSSDLPKPTALLPPPNPVSATKPTTPTPNVATTPAQPVAGPVSIPVTQLTNPNVATLAAAPVPIPATQTTSQSVAAPVQPMAGPVPIPVPQPTNPNVADPVQPVPTPVPIPATQSINLSTTAHPLAGPIPIPATQLTNVTNLNVTTPIQSVAGPVSSLAPQPTNLNVTAPVHPVASPFPILATQPANPNVASLVPPVAGPVPIPATLGPTAQANVSSSPTVTVPAQIMAESSNLVSQPGPISVSCTTTEATAGGTAAAVGEGGTTAAATVSGTYGVSSESVRDETMTSR